MQPASLKSDSNSSAAVWGSFCGGPLANFKFRIGRSRHCTMMLSYYIYRGQLSPLWWFLFFLNYLICSILCYIVFGASPCWPTWNGFHWTNSSFTHSLWCNIPLPPCCFYVGSNNERLLYNSYHDWSPSGSCFHAAISHDCFMPRAPRAAKHCGPQIKMLSVAL